MGAMVSRVFVIGRELGDQLVRCMAIERVEVLIAEGVDEVRFDREVRAVVLDASEVSLEKGFLLNLREGAQAPLICVATFEEARKALSFGCDEVLVRPFGLEELKLRAHRMLGLVKSESLIAGDLLIDLRKRRVRRGEEEINLTKLEFDLLAYLVREKGRVVRYEELLEEVWGYDYDEGSFWQVKTATKRLRRKLREDAAEPKYIVNIRGIGYMIKEEGVSNKR
jgi:DNA-binding response OmpR family regulator